MDANGRQAGPIKTAAEIFFVTLFLWVTLSFECSATRWERRLRSRKRSSTVRLFRRGPPILGDRCSFEEFEHGFKKAQTDSAHQGSQEANTDESPSMASFQQTKSASSTRSASSTWSNSTPRSGRHP